MTLETPIPFLQLLGIGVLDDGFSVLRMVTWAGPGPMKEGDCLCLLFGGGVPYILRPKDGRYIFIGDCYVEGLMEGQALIGIVGEQLFEIV